MYMNDCIALEHPLSTYFVRQEDALDLKGGYGVVYPADVTPAAKAEISATLPDKVAVKKMKLLPEILPVVVNEIQTLRGLNLPHAVKYYGCFTRKDLVYLVMEWAQGYELAEILNNPEVYLSQSVKGEIAFELAKAIQEFHTAGYTHRDIKVDNVMFSLRDGRVDGLKLIDYGFVCHQTRPCAPGLGTRDYMDSAGRQSDFESLVRADWYAYGVTLLLLYQNSFARVFRKSTPAIIKALLNPQEKMRPSPEEIMDSFRPRRSRRTTSKTIYE